MAAVHTHGDQIVALVGAVYIVHSEAEEEYSFVLICQEPHCCRRNFRRMAVAAAVWCWNLTRFDNGLKMSLALLVLRCSHQCSVSHSCYKTIRWELVLSHIVGRFYLRYSLMMPSWHFAGVTLQLRYLCRLRRRTRKGGVSWELPIPQTRFPLLSSYTIMHPS